MKYAIVIAPTFDRDGKYIAPGLVWTGTSWSRKGAPKLYRTSKVAKSLLNGNCKFRAQYRHNFVPHIREVTLKLGDIQDMLL